MVLSESDNKMRKATGGCGKETGEWLILRELSNIIFVLEVSGMNFAEKLSNLRIQKGYSQEALAEKLHVSRQAVSKWEVGTTLPETDKLIVISEFFQVSLDYLLKDNIRLNQDESLDRIVLRFLGAAQDMDEISGKLVEIMKDGVIDCEEKKQINRIMESLDEISEIIIEIKQRMNI
jgi:transcriptional regulator with XRE-family HTH domain